MNVRIISGQYGGRKIDAPDGRRMHPMGERIRNALFNSLGDEIHGACVLDAFAGTGAVGIEALSRGAANVTFVEKDRICQRIVGNNIELLKITERTTLIKSPLASWLKANQNHQFDFIFADPPYHDPQLSTVSQLFALLKPQACMVLSHPGRSEVPTKPGVVVVDNRSYGNAYLTFYRRVDA